MLILRRKLGEEITIETNGIRGKITITEINGSSVRLGFTFPREINIRREEVQDETPANL